MSASKRTLLTIIAGDAQADRVVPPSGFTAQLTLFVSAAMAFLAVFAFALSFASGRLAERWDAELARSVTLRISAPPEQQAAQTSRALDILGNTQGVISANALNDSEQAALLAPWFGTDMSLEGLPVPRLVAVETDGALFDADGLRLRLAAEVPGAVLDDHARWRAPLVSAADRLRYLGWGSALLIAVTLAAMVSLAANAALAANGQIIAVLRHVGATDRYIAEAFIRRFTLRAFAGGALGAVIAAGIVLLLPPAGAEAGLLSGFGLYGAEWLAPLCLPLATALVALLATRHAATRALRKLA